VSEMTHERNPEWDAHSQLIHAHFQVLDGSFLDITLTLRASTALKRLCFDVA
jgi:hypothetical protein